jgi:pimeloyl-ACP methyl ester carboxylesterase
MQAQMLELSDGSRLAYRHRAGRGPGVLFCPGFNSDMQGTKALALDDWCRDRGQQYTRFDYFGHGSSSGAPGEGTIGRWRDDLLAVLDHVTTGRQLVVGSSMGGWMMLLAALARPQRVLALVGIATAADFTERLRDERLGEVQRRQLEERGYCDLPNCYDDGQPYRIHRQLLDEGRHHLLLGGPIDIEVPVRLIHGQCDEDVPWRQSLLLAERLRSRDVELQLVKSGDHRLSEPGDLQRLFRTLEALLAAL